MMKAIVLVTEQVTMTAFCLTLKGRPLVRFILARKHDFQPDSYDIPVKEVVTCK